MLQNSIYFYNGFWSIAIDSKLKQNVSINNLTILWAFSEAALGGILHAFKVPFTGLFVGSIAVIVITLIAKSTDQPKTILTVTLKVILVKFFVSPHSPINAYLAVFIQSLLGYLLFFRGYNTISPIILGILSQLISSLQKLIVLTIIFGMTLWESIDVFFNYVLETLGITYSENYYTISVIIIYAYIISHLIGGIFAGIYAIKLPDRLVNNKIVLKENNIKYSVDEIKKKKRKISWWLKPNSILIFIMSVSIIILSYFNNNMDDDIVTKVIIMIIRSVMILVVWYYFISPVLLNLLSKILKNKENENLDEVKNIISIFPHLKRIISYSWNSTTGLFFVYRPFKFIDNVILNFLSQSNNE